MKWLDHPSGWVDVLLLAVLCTVLVFGLIVVLG